VSETKGGSDLSGVCRAAMEKKRRLPPHHPGTRRDEDKGAGGKLRSTSDLRSPVATPSSGGLDPQSNTPGTYEKGRHLGRRPEGKGTDSVRRRKVRGKTEPKQAQRGQSETNAKKSNKLSHRKKRIRKKRKEGNGEKARGRAKLLF